MNMADGDAHMTVGKVEELRYDCNNRFGTNDDSYSFNDNDTQELLRAMYELGELYLEELNERKIECQNVNCECMTDLLKSWLKDLQTQNEGILLMHDETETSGKKILKELEKKCRQIKSQVFKCKLEKGKNKIVLENLQYEKTTFEQQYQKVQAEIKELDAVQAEMKKEVKSVQKDVENLSELAHRLTSRGCWDISNLQLGLNDYETLFKGHSDIIGSPCTFLKDLCKQKTTEVVKKEELKADIRAINEVILDKNIEIDELRRKYISLICEGSETQNAESLTMAIRGLELTEVKSEPIKVTVISKEKNIQTIVQIPTTNKNKCM